MKNKIEEIISKHIDDKYKKYCELVEQAVQQAIITGECHLKFEDNEVKIVNPFKGCDCDIPIQSGNEK